MTTREPLTEKLRVALTNLLHAKDGKVIACFTRSTVSLCATPSPLSCVGSVVGLTNTTVLARSAPLNACCVRARMSNRDTPPEAPCNGPTSTL
jgi:hypothetical protein